MIAIIVNDWSILDFRVLTMLVAYSRVQADCHIRSGLQSEIPRLVLAVLIDCIMCAVSMVAGSSLEPQA
ncbi:hypothetical protein K491DRAFT_693495, partial [Lophiostoma macrostomum CBS 122681]